MSMKIKNLKDYIGAEVDVEIETLLKPETGQQLRNALVERGVLVFRGLHLNDEQQAELARLLGTLREEQGASIFKITLDKNVNTSADYLKGSFLWHIDGTHDDVPPFATLLTGRVLS